MSGTAKRKKPVRTKEEGRKLALAMKKKGVSNEPTSSEATEPTS